MAAILTEELRQELAREGDRPIQIVDPCTQKVYVLVSAEMFERLKLLLDDTVDIRDKYAAQETALGKVWSDSELDEYAEYDRHRQQS